MSVRAIAWLRPFEFQVYFLRPIQHKKSKFV